MSTQPYVTREDNDANNERIRHFLLLIFFLFLFKPQLEDPRISVSVLLFSFTSYSQETTNNMTLWKSVVTYILAPYVQS